MGMDPATLMAGSAVASGLIGADAASSASSAAANSANNATNAQLQMYNQTRTDNTPWRQAGSTAVGQLANLTADGTASDPNSFLHRFDQQDLINGLSPNYDWRQGQMRDALNNQESVSGGLDGGNALKGIADYTNNAAGDAYQQAFNNYNSQQTNIFNRLSNIAGLGGTANQTVANASSNAANGIGNAAMAGGAAQAAGITGVGNAISGSINNMSSMYVLNKLTNNQLFGNGSGATSSGLNPTYYAG